MSNQLRKTAFLNLLAEGASISYAAETVDVSRVSLYNWREKDPLFKAEWDHCYKLGEDALEQEAIRRAIEGTAKPVYQQGIRVGVIQEYSDTLLIFLLKSRNPHKYCERVRSAAIEAESEAKRLEAEASNNSQASAAVINFLNDLASQKAALAKKADEK